MAMIGRGLKTKVNSAVELKEKKNLYKEVE